jgi:hypothetical protein
MSRINKYTVDEISYDGDNDTNSVKLPSSETLTMSKKSSKKFLKIFAISSFSFLFAIIVGIYFFVYLPAQKVMGRLNSMKSKASEMKTIFAQNDIDLIATKTAELKVEFDKLKVDSQAFAGFSFIPHVRDYFALLEAGDSLLQASSDAIVAIEPFADLIGFKKGKANFFEKTAEERLETAVLTLDKLMTKIDPISEEISNAKAKIDSINPDRYPSEIGGIKVKEQILNAQDQFDGVYRLIVNAQPFLKKLPDIMGKSEKQKYLVIFQNDKERRATGGFWTGTTEISVDKGKLVFDKVTNIYDIDDRIPSDPAPAPIKNYFKGVDVLNLRDTNLSPDLVESIKLFEAQYKKYGDKAEYDGIILIDTKILVDMLEIFGDTNASGVTFSSKIDDRCDCPQVIYELSDNIGRPVGYIKAERKAILSSLLRELMFKAIGFSPSRYWGRLVQTMIINMDEKHILLNFVDKDTQSAVEKMGWAGRVAENDKNDYLHFVGVNFGGQKSNLFVKEQVDFVSGQEKNTVTVTFRNPYPGSDCNLERGNLCLNAPLRNWIRFYVPKGSKLISFTGSRTETRTYDELGKTVFEGFMIVDPMGKAEVKIEYKVPDDINQDKLIVQKQAGVLDQTWRIVKNGKKAFEGILLKDVEL